MPNRYTALTSRASSSAWNLFPQIDMKLQVRSVELKLRNLSVLVPWNCEHLYFKGNANCITNLFFFLFVDSLHNCYGRHPGRAALADPRSRLAGPSPASRERVGRFEQQRRRSREACSMSYTALMELSEPAGGTPPQGCDLRGRTELPSRMHRTKTLGANIRQEHSCEGTAANPRDRAGQPRHASR